MSDPSEQRLLSAVHAFREARWRAVLEQIQARLTGKSANLLSYEAVRSAIGGREAQQRELEEIPIDAIVGSVGRYTDFTRSFLPRVEKDEDRWARVYAQMDSLTGLPPIEVFRIGDVYFVRDGNHRVSVARQQGFSHIEAYVTEVSTPVPLMPDMDLETFIIQVRQAAFLEQTGLATVVPDIDLTMSVAGNYRVLDNQIRQHQQALAHQTSVEIAYPQAAQRWYEDIYLPLVQFIRRRGILRDFPDRTETDLYVWLDRHQEALAEHLGWSVDAETAVLDLADTQASNSLQKIQQLGQKLRDAVTPAVLESGPAVGEWRESWLATYREDRLFSHILVGIDGQDTGWHALQQALRIAQREQGKLFGVHVAQATDSDGQAARDLRVEFERRCAEADIPGDITITTGPVTGTLCYRARWADMVVVSLSHPPGPQPVDRLSSQFGQLLRRCPRPVLAVPRTHADLSRILLAYDGSPKADEALYVAVYLARQWQTTLTVVVALGKRVKKETAVRVRTYLTDKELQANYVVEAKSPAALIIETARAQDCGLIVMGGYGLQPALAIVAGSTVDEVLRTRNRPVLICR